MRPAHRPRLPVLTVGIAAVAAVSLTGAVTSGAAASATAHDAHASRAAAAAKPIYLNPAYSPEERAADLVSRMTLAEKASEMISSQSAAIPRLGVAAYGWWNEALHGVAREGTLNNANPPVLTNTTSYPMPLSLGSTWNRDLMYQESTQISDEAREVAPNNTLDLNYYSPTINLGRDPRWGRNDETYSEDPYLTAAIASQFVDGMEGKNQNGQLLPQAAGYQKTDTTIKHFAANNSEFNRLNGSSDMDERTLREYYTAQFKGVIQQAHPASIMSAYNEVNGVPSPANVHLIDTLARETYGFGGFFTSDCDAVYIMQAQHHWQPPGYPTPLDQVSRGAFANSAGEDLECQQGYHDAYSYANTTQAAIAAGIHTQTDTYNENDVDTSLVRLFASRIAMGEFDNENQIPWVRQARQQLAPGTWVNSDANNAVTETPARLALARKAGDQSIVLLKNNSTTKKDGTKGTLLPLRVPHSGPFKVAVIGYYANPPQMYLGGYSSNQGPHGVAKEVNGYQGLKTAIQAIDPQATVDFLPGVTGSDLGTVDQASVDAAANYDAVIAYAGTDASTANEGGDRGTLNLPGAQADMINQVAAKNPNTIAYMETIGAVNVTSFEPNVAAMLWSSYNGQRKGESLADVVLGAANPSGHLPFTWYRDDSQLPGIADYSIRPSSTSPGRTYMYFTGQPSYPFGYGLSYDNFQFSNLHVDKTHLDANDTLHVNADITNTGDVPGAEVAQLYVATPDAAANAQRPAKRLEGFAKVSLQPHQTAPVSFTVKVPDLAFYDQNLGRFTVDDGAYGIQLGASSADIRQQALVTVSGALEPVPSVVTAKPVAAGDAAQGIQDRVFFPVGATVDPQLTVSMNDESLYGYITKGASTPLPPGTSVSYRSDRPDVVRASGDGSTLRAVSAGPATITATVTYHGQSATGSFVVDVQ
jgi:beta-glucosidase